MITNALSIQSYDSVYSNYMMTEITKKKLNDVAVLKKNLTNLAKRNYL